MYIRLHVKCPLFLWDFNEAGIFSTDFGKSSNTKFRKKNPSSGSQIAACGRMDGRTDGRTDGYTYIRKLVFATLRLNLKTM